MVRVVPIVIHIILFGLCLKRNELCLFLRYCTSSGIIDVYKAATHAPFLNVCLLHTSTALTKARLFIKERSREILPRLYWK